MGKKRRFFEIGETAEPKEYNEAEELKSLTKNEKFVERLKYLSKSKIIKPWKLEEVTDDDFIEERANSRQVMKLPDDGGYLTPENIPFHHLVSTEPRPHHIARLMKHGIRIRSGAFTPDEIEIVQKNWREFADEHKIKDEDAWEIIGVCGFSRSQIERNEERKWLREINFLPAMCKGLLERSGAQTNRFLRSHFHPSSLSQVDLRRPWTEEDEQTLKAALEKKPNCNMEELSVKMKRNRRYLWGRVLILRSRETEDEELTPESQYKVWEKIKTAMYPKNPLKLIINGEHWRKALNKEQLEQIAATLLFSTAQIERTWIDIGLSVLEINKEDPNLTLKDIENRAFNVPKKLDVETVKKCIDFILSMHGYDSMGQINHARLTKWIRDNGMEFRVFNGVESEGRMILGMIQIYMRSLSDCGFLDKLPLDVDIRDLLRMLSELFERNLVPCANHRFKSTDLSVKKAIKEFRKKLKAERKEIA